MKNLKIYLIAFKNNTRNLAMVYNLNQKLLHTSEVVHDLRKRKLQICSRSHTHTHTYIHTHTHTYVRNCMVLFMSSAPTNDFKGTLPSAHGSNPVRRTKGSPTCAASVISLSSSSSRTRVVCPGSFSETEPII
ncbi:hypothetical protein P5V15_015861 [Pogonomyrmex californicus]